MKRFLKRMILSVGLVAVVSGTMLGANQVLNSAASCRSRCLSQKATCFDGCGYIKDRGRKLRCYAGCRRGYSACTRRCR